MYSVKAHEQLVNCVDGCGGLNVNSGPPELATGSRDGRLLASLGDGASTRVL